MRYDLARDHELFDELRQVLEPGFETREEAAHAATHLLVRDSGTFQLVALIENGNRAAYYQPSMYSLTSRPYGSEGVLGDRARKEGGHLTSQLEVQAWLDDYWGEIRWRHPRFRTD